MSTDQYVRGIDFIGSHFSTLYQGIVLEPSPISSTYDPRGVGASFCDFDTIYAEGILAYVGRTTTAQNTFGDVGNHFGGITQPYTSIINFASSNNIL